MRDLGDTTAYLRRGIREILCLALFVFTFLAVEYLFDVRVAEFVPSNEVVIYESIVIGASVIGFFVRPLLYYRRPQAIAATSDITGVLLVSALLLMCGGLFACRAWDRAHARGKLGCFGRFWRGCLRRPRSCTSPNCGFFHCHPSATQQVVPKPSETAEFWKPTPSGDRLSITLGPFTIRGLAACALHELDGDKRLHLGLLAAQQGE